MNIRVDLNYPIADGTEVVFRSPVDCSQVTGLILYYPGEGEDIATQEFAFADAHGNNVGDIDHLFAENVVVKVILDVTHSMAFVQNADTNAYLENKFLETIGKCCPSFAESGSIVTCEPVEGYPLVVITHIPDSEAGVESLTLHHTGKNLWDFKSGMDVCRGISGGTGADILRYGYIVELPPGTYTISAEVVTAGDYIYFNPINLDTLVMGALTYFHTGQSAVTPVRVTLKERQGLYFYDAGRLDTTSAGHRALVEKAFYENVNIQIEAGTVATPYEPYQGEKKTVAFDSPVVGGAYNWTTGELAEDAVKLEFTGTETIYHNHMSGVPVEGQFYMKLPYANEANVACLCSHLTGTVTDAYYKTKNKTVSANSGYLWIYDTDYKTVDELKAWLQEQYAAETPFSVVYKVSSPVLAQLEPQEIVGCYGTNRLFSSTGNTEVSGKADPTAVIEKLTNAILALGGNV